jgi:hypothetical protein
MHHSRRSFRLLAVAAFLGCIGLAPSQAHASAGFDVWGGWTFNGGGFGTIKPVNPSYGFEVLAGIAKSDAFQLGFFYDMTTLYFDSGASGSVPFLGGVVRVELQSLKGLFVDFKVGSTHTNNGSTNSDNALGFGFGAGYRIPLGKVVSLKPHVEYRSLPNVVGSVSTSQTALDSAFMLSFLF